jgi:hypothetical protein
MVFVCLELDEFEASVCLELTVFGKMRIFCMIYRLNMLIMRSLLRFCFLCRSARITTLGSSIAAALRGAGFAG